MEKVFTLFSHLQTLIVPCNNFDRYFETKKYNTCITFNYEILNVQVFIQTDT